MEINKSNILEALKTVDDPDFKQDLVTLKMVGDIEIKGQNVLVNIILTTPACPLKDKIQQDCENAVHNLVNQDINLTIEFSSNVTSKREVTNLLPGVKNIIAVASGKGGVGKSTVSVNLALGLAKDGAKVGLLDADIYGPSIPMMMGMKGTRPAVEKVNGKDKIVPAIKHGTKILSIGFLVDEKQAVVWRGPMVSSALRQFVTDCQWGDLDYLIIDLPPGTGDIHLTLVQTLPLTGAIIVTTPQNVATADAEKGIAMFNMGQIKVPILGVVENMAYFSPPELPDNRYYIFGSGGGKKLSEKYQIPFLGEIPIVQAIQEGGDNGQPAVLGNDTQTGKSFEQLAKNLAQQVSIINAQNEFTKPVEIIY